MSRMLTASECAAWLLAYDDYLIISHRRPDGDTLGSGAALCSALRRAGRRARCFDNPETISLHRPFVEPYVSGDGGDYSTLVTVDVASEGLFPDGVTGPVPLAVDHHPSNSGFAENLCLAAGYSSCGELVLEIIRALCGSVTKEEANLLYFAVTTDTGCFQYMNTDAHTLRSAAELIDCGAESGKLSFMLFRTMSRARMALEGAMLSNMRFCRGGKVTANLVTLKMLAECGASEDDCDDLAGLAGKAEGCMISLTIREVAEGESKVSARCKPGINVSDICAVYGGGGHAMAAGVTLKCPPEEALEKMLRAIDEKYPEL